MRKEYLLGASILVFILMLITYNTFPEKGGWFLLAKYSTFHITGLFALICGLFAARRYGLNNAHGSALYHISLGIGAWLIADITYNILKYAFSQEPFPSFIDIVYLIGYPLIIIGLMKEVKFLQIRWDAAKILKAIVISFFFMLVAVIYIGITIFNQENKIWADIFSLLYAIGDVALAVISVFIMIVTFEYQKGKFFTPWLNIFIGIFILFAADILYNIFFYQYDSNIGWSQNIDLVYAVSYLLFAYGFFGLDYLLLQVQKKAR